MSVTRKILKEWEAAHPGKHNKDGSYTEPGKVFLYCPHCGAESSASSGDYWRKPDDEVFVCDHEGEPSCEEDTPTEMVLAYTCTAYIDAFTHEQI